ncbi:putative ubiquitin hydrolase [Leptomonas pyrrhocoris]|uniref:ubiquitinyl hydrolase 1 n=1 Tax=Leptomonas pyrrhocoris TaxID=157538 RepID=A0A0M9FXD0_LEPPY|nr:putative ubiquitin hydrolase [Leptomonas pyrrhocoris]KPA77877.1 putative ubiquitin hydrolase [Leptomonas pyrrhocoris]|eukprot:XP_015656316.1 putative ubiquitin hydrolase [Leptomonas pyrrhocoris]
MPHVETAFSVAATDVRLPPTDVWAAEVLERCAAAHYIPQRNLLNVLAPLPSSSSTTVQKAATTQAHVFIDVDAEEDADVLSASPYPNSLSGGGGSSYQPYLPRMERAAPTTEMQAVRAALSSPLLHKAYHLQIPCVMSHSTKGERLLNCAASPRCMSGLRTLAGDAVTREDCLRVVMGDGPRVVKLPVPSPGAAAADAEDDDPLSSVNGSATGSRKGARASSSAAAATASDELRDSSVSSAAAAALSTATTTTRTVVGDPAFPCLWRGVRNLMNTCYFSSVLQMVFSVARLRRAILNDGAAEHGAPTGTAAAGVANTQLEESGLKELFALMAFSREGAGADPKSFASYLSLDVKVQQDAQEFFTLLLDWLRCHCGPAVQTAVTATFAGTLLYDRRCGACGRSTKRAEPFLYLSLPVRSTLEDSLSEYSKPEEVDGFTCEGCGKTAVATSRQYIRTLPDVLVVHWNRFEFDLQTLQRHKVATATSFPLQLDMAAYVRQWHEHKHRNAAPVNKASSVTATTQPTTTTAAASAAGTAGGSASGGLKENFCYELRGVVNHLGDTAVSGHYTYHGKVSTTSPAASTVAASQQTWLNFNDAEVTTLNRYQGQRGVSADAYLLVYHRITPALSTSPPTTSAAPTKSTSVTTGSAASALATSPSAVPTPAEFPLYLRQYVDQVNQRCLDERQAWLGQRAQVAAFYDLWAATAQAVFDVPTSAWASTVATGSSTTTTAAATTMLYALPTAWLQQLGRLFLPAYVDVAALGGGAESQRKRNKNDAAEGVAGGSAGSGDRNNHHNRMNELSGAVGAAPSTEEEESAAASDDAPADGVVVGTVSMGPRRHGYIQSLEEIYQLVRQHSLLQALPPLLCLHGYLAPWGAYKLVSAAAYTKLAHFLHVCGAPLKAVGSTANSTQSSGAVDAQTSCAFAESNFCPLCVAAMAATVHGMAAAAAEDEQAELCLTQAWRDAESKKEAEEGNISSGGGEVEGGPKNEAAPNLHHNNMNGTSDAAAAAAKEEDEGGLVLVSETVVEGWASYYVAQGAWSRVQQTGGYTAVVVMKEARLSPPRAPSSTHNTFPGNSRDNSRSSATSPSPSPTGATTTTTTISPTLASAAPTLTSVFNVFNVDKGDLDLSSQLLCPHGALRPGQHVLAIPAPLRRYWIRRFAELLTTAHRAGQLRTADPAWRATEGDVEHFLLPYVPASTTSTTCLECMRTSVQALTSRHHQRLRKMEERKKFPSLWLAGAMTSPAGVAQLLLATGAENEEQLLAAQHPNRLFFKHNAEREHREYVRKWTEAQQARIAHQASEVTRLQTTVAKKREHDAAWDARVTSRRGGRGAGRGGGGGRDLKAHSTATSPSPSPPDPETLEGRLFYAEEALAQLRAQPVPDFDVSYGCVPTWWVARWYAAMQDDGPASPSPVPVVDRGEGAGSKGNEEAEGGDAAASTNPLPPISYRAFLCEHGCCLLDVPWLNPSDGFWQGVRGKRADVLWNGVQVERATVAQQHDAPKGKGVSAASSSASAAVAESGPGKAEYRSQCWLPPLVILPMEEYLTLLAQYVTPTPPETPLGNGPRAAEESVDGKPTTKEQTSFEATSAGGAAPSAQRSPPSLSAATIQVVMHNGVRQLQPAPCAACCAKLLASFEVNCESFVNGSLKLNFHVRKSRKNFYDASSVLTSAAVQQSKASEVSAATASAAASSAPLPHGRYAGAPPAVLDDDDTEESNDPHNIKATASATAAAADHTAKGDAIPDGIHYYTTLAQLRTYISAHLREKHGYLVPPEELQITRGKNKPLKLRTPPSQETTGNAAEGTEESSALEHASLQELGIKDGEALSVQSVDNIAPVCATAPGVDEEWEAIPPELLQAGGAAGVGQGGEHGAAAAKEHSAAFRETRLQGRHAVGRSDASGAAAETSAPSSSSAAPASGTALSSAVTGTTAGVPGAASVEQPVACAVCTFLNAPGMVVCEMCEAPLPSR